MAKKKTGKKKTKAENVEEKVAQQAKEAENAAANETEGTAENQASEATGEQDELTRLQAELEASKKRAEEATDQYLRLMAEFDNFRKRTRRENEAFREYASEQVLKTLLPVLDDFDRTLTAMEKTDNLTSLKEGIVMVTGKLHKALEKEGLNEIQAVGEEFDSALHDAIHSVEVPDEQKGTVLEQVEKGYRLKDKVIRYAKVVVGE